MLSDQQFREYVRAHELSESAVEYIQEVRRSEPSRMVGVGAKSNVVSFVPSRKMNFTISTESRAPERAFLLISEFDERVVEIWDQPRPILIHRTDINGRKINRWYTPDFLILTESGPVIIEVKSKHHVDVLLKRYPSDWMHSEANCFSYVPAEQAFSRIGLSFKVFVYSNELRYLVNNIELLQQSRRFSLTINELKLDRLFMDSFVWSLFDLKQAMQLESYLDLVALIDQRKLHIDLDHHLLSEPKACLVVRDARLLKEAKDLLDRGKLADPLVQHGVGFAFMPSEKYAQDVLCKIEKINSGLSHRSIRRWKQLIKDGGAQGLTSFQALISKKFLSGNRARRLPDTVISFLEHHIRNNYIKAPGLSIYRSYIVYRVDAMEHHANFAPVAWETYRQHIHKLPAGMVAGGRGGQRAENKDSEPTDPTERILKPDLPWRMVSIDNYLADIYLIFFSDDGTVWVMRPWLTVMVDNFSGEVLGFAVSFQAPSRKSVCKVIRDCVRRHGKLPYEIIVDRGSEFKSVYFAALMAHFGCIYTLRPSGNPKFSSEVERLFGEFKEQWLSQRKGNLADYKEVRSVDGAFHPKKYAVLTPYDFYREFEAFCEWRRHKPKGIAVESISDRFNVLSHDYPFVSINVAFDDEFLLATAVETNSYPIDFNRGIHIGPLHYWSPKLGQLRGKKSSTEVRFDPENPHLIYARVNNHWEVCLTSHANRFSALDPISQKIEMLRVVESKNSKSLVARSADEELVRKIRAMDAISEGINHQSKIIEIPEVVNESPSMEKDIFSSVLANPIRQLSVESW